MPEQCTAIFIGNVALSTGWQMVLDIFLETVIVRWDIFFATSNV